MKNRCLLLVLKVLKCLLSVKFEVYRTEFLAAIYFLRFDFSF